MSVEPFSHTFVLIDDSREDGAGALLFEQPEEIIAAHLPGEVDKALARLSETLASARYVAGFMSYELGYALEPRLAPLMPSARRCPLLWFGVFDAPRTLDATAAADWLETRAAPGHGLALLGPDFDEQAYLERFARVEEAIYAGDLYQANLTFKYRFALSGNPLSLYRAMRSAQPVRHAAYIAAPTFTVMSASPEQYLTIREGHIETRPMKGTAPRKEDAAADRRAREDLAADEKNRAENLMIVDLMRNDLGRIAKVGSVEAPKLFEVETYATVHQMVSLVRARLRENVSISDLVRGVFPPGSVTGAPKIRAMELIRELEAEPRGVYCGAIGMFAPDGSADFNVAIRTAVYFADGTGEFGIGSGIVADSSGTDEYAECLLKMKFFEACTGDFRLIESLRWTKESGYWLLDEHIARLARSAQALGFALDLPLARVRLAEAPGPRDEPVLFVRLLLSREGGIEVSVAPLQLPDPSRPLRFTISEFRVSSADSLLAHKTTRREFYDREHARLAAAHGLDEVLFLNEHGELTEGSRTNIFIEREGRLLTPPLSAGVLPGTLRARLIADGRAIEAPLTLEDLEPDQGVYLGNSVRGLLPARRAETR
ncbi:MAG: hypothetical protein RLZ98_2750 [Pseudomonadota bacterium]|jgi:para-aminobenzoate synthetase/4-amino-4-deoxychorismate lyase